MASGVGVSPGATTRLGLLLRSSIGQKVVMAITGLLLTGFLFAHVAGNLLMFVGPEAYNNYAHTLHSQEWFVKTAEAGLILLFAAHIYLAISTARKNTAGRQTTYVMRKSKLGRTLGLTPSSWMFVSGSVVLGFLLLHLSDFAFQIRPDMAYEGKEPFEKAIMILQNPISLAVYIVGCTVLGFHLAHGFWSALTTLGLSHNQYSRAIHKLSVGLAILLAGTFAIMPIWALFQ